MARLAKWAALGLATVALAAWLTAARGRRASCDSGGCVAPLAAPLPPAPTPVPPRVGRF